MLLRLLLIVFVFVGGICLGNFFTLLGLAAHDSLREYTIRTFKEHFNL